MAKESELIHSGTKSVKTEKISSWNNFLIEKRTIIFSSSEQFSTSTFDSPGQKCGHGHAVSSHMDVPGTCP